jgi:hypothetical protein
MVSEMLHQIAYTKGLPAQNSRKRPKPAIESIFVRHLNPTWLLSLGLFLVVIRMELRMGVAGAILSMMSDGNAPGAWSVWASRGTKWDK